MLISETQTSFILNVASTGNIVRDLQHMLYSFDYYVGPKSGLFDDSTKAVVAKFQAVLKLDGEGVVTPATWDKLVSEYYVLTNNDTESKSIRLQDINRLYNLRYSTPKYNKFEIGNIDFESETPPSSRSSRLNAYALYYATSVAPLVEAKNKCMLHD